MGFVSSYSLAFILLLISSSSIISWTALGFRGGEEGDEGAIAMGTLGGIKEKGGNQNSAEIEELARFAVDEHNKKENALLEFARVVKAKEQVVSGTLHHLTLEAIDAGKKKLYEAKVWVKPWLNSKELQEFTHAGGSTSERDVHGSGLRPVPSNDPVVQDAANHAVKIIQQRSNSLAPYVLLEILHAKAEVIEDFAKFHMLLKVKRGSKEEKFNVEVHKNREGTLNLNHMQQEHLDSGSQ